MPPRRRPYVVPDEKRKLSARSTIDGGARIGNCPRCDEPVIDGLCDGVTLRLSRFSVPYKDALILGKYARCNFNVWIGAMRLYVSYWHPTEGRPDQGWLFNDHICTCRR